MVISGNSLVAIASPSNPEIKEWTEQEVRNFIRNKYPALADTLICMVKNESTYCQNKIPGDHGLAYGCYQIHIDKHPVSEWCALDLECSLDFTVKMIQAGKGFLWTTFDGCN